MRNSVQNLQNNPPTKNRTDFGFYLHSTASITQSGVMSTLKYLLIDGHSVIFAWKMLRTLHQRKPRSAREQLIKTTQILHDSGKWKVTLVFDGKTRGSEETRPQDMIIAYASENETADSLIERTIGAFPYPDQICVVTDDHAEAQTVLSLGAHTESSEWLEAEIQSSQNQLDTTLKSLHQKKSSPSIQF